MKVEIISRKAIKPSCPTPPHRKDFKLSLLDQTFPSDFYGNIIFYYSSINHKYYGGDLASQLQTSLSKTLVHFYPLAGRLKDAVSIDCNDDGAHFVEAQINCHLVDFLDRPNPDLLHQFIPTCNDALGFGIVLLVQLNFFKCGGVAVAVSLSHKIGDASSLCTFVQSWTATAHDQVVPPEFIGPSLLPASDKLQITRTFDVPSPNFITRRFVFSASKIATLKAKTTSALQHDLHINGTKEPTNVELLSALVLKCAINAASRHQSISRPSLVFHAINLRKRMVNPLPSNTIGNLVWSLPILVEDNDDIKLHEVVTNTRKGITEFCNGLENRFKGEDGFNAVYESLRKEGELSNMEINKFRCTSLCKFPLYDMDFGWGKPIWVTCPTYFKNLIRLLDAKWGGDIEAWVTLEKTEMAIFERDEMLLSFASLNPSAVLGQCRM